MFRRLIIIAAILTLAINLTILNLTFAADKDKKNNVKQEKVDKADKKNNVKQEKLDKADKKVDKDEDKKPEKTAEELKAYENQCSEVNAIDLVSNPEKFLDKYVLIEGQFDKYTTLGLDYKPVAKSSKDFITFLIRRPETKSKKFIIPLSELKLIVSRKTAETYTSLETGDQIRIYGKVISDALNDSWVEVDHVFSPSKDITVIPKDNEGNSKANEDNE